jgi:hypothetical protein
MTARAGNPVRFRPSKAGGLMRTLQTHDRPTPLARALEELGRIIKTLYMLRYIDDEAYRRRILTQLNRGEGRHELARIFLPRQAGRAAAALPRRPGRSARCARAGRQCRHPVEYMDTALAELRAEGFDVRDEDVARLSPPALRRVPAACSVR